MRTLNWTWESSLENIKLFDEGKQIGFIRSFADNKTSIINNKQFFLDCPNKWSSTTYISDPLDKKAYCEIEFFNSYGLYRIFSPSFDYSSQKISFWPLKRRVYISSKGIRMAELIIPGGFFKNKGIINLYQEENFELFIFCLFYLNSINNSSD